MRTFLLSLFLLPTLLLGNPSPHFNPKMVQQFKGEIVSVQTYSDVTRPNTHKQIFLRTVKGEIVVDLGPEWYIDLQGINLYAGEEVIVVGSLTKLNGTVYVIASSIKINDTLFKLREKNGVPVWRGKS